MKKDNSKELIELYLLIISRCFLVLGIICLVIYGSLINILALPLGLLMTLTGGGSLYFVFYAALLIAVIVSFFKHKVGFIIPVLIYCIVYSQFNEHATYSRRMFCDQARGNPRCGPKMDGDMCDLLIQRNDLKEFSKEDCIAGKYQ